VVVESVYSIGIVVSITLCLLYIVLLDIEELIFSGRLPLRAHYFVLVCYLKLLLLGINLKESLICAVRSPDLVPYIKSFYTDIASTLLLVHLSVFLLIVLSH
jgi:hypothetical protein